jgi:bifunctional UDP-N-acetylglucosamine pyrophosphorylase/glucosamine-1-phosphate N-acetyltransferase
MRNLDIVILAAGQGKRMHSDIPKVLHAVGGISMLQRVIDTAQSLNPESIFVVYGNGGSSVRDAMSHASVNWVEQKEQKGTGHAVQQALPKLNPQNRILILYADVPLIDQASLSELLEHSSLSIIVSRFNNPRGLGRMLRNDDGYVTAIVEERDASDEQRKIHEINSGIIASHVSDLNRWLPKLKNANAQQEFYLTDIVSLAVSEGQKIYTVEAPEYAVRGINDRIDLANVERIYQRKKVEDYLLQGVTFLDPARFDLRGKLTVGKDVIFDVNVIIEGNVSIGNACKIGANCILKNVTLADNVAIEPNSIIDGAVIDSGATIGPFARIRPGTMIGKQAKIGNFVEVKNTIVGEGTKANHLSYLGDATLGSQVNIGAGTITCNYDGVKKHKTIIEDFAFIGSDTQLVAPVKIGARAVIGAGSTITKDAPPGELTLSRVTQKTIEGWKRDSGKDPE